MFAGKRCWLRKIARRVEDSFQNHPYDSDGIFALTSYGKNSCDNKLWCYRVTLRKKKHLQEETGECNEPDAVAYTCSNSIVNLQLNMLLIWTH